MVLIIIYHIFIVVSIQKANKSRLIAFKGRMMFLSYYWDNMKVDMTKVLLSDTVTPEKAKVVSTKIFATNVQVKDMIVTKYVQYCRLKFILQYLKWRQKKVLYYSIESTFDW